MVQGEMMVFAAAFVAAYSAGSWSREDALTHAIATVLEFRKAVDEAGERGHPYEQVQWARQMVTPVASR